ncbi:MAG: Eco57I restriction-modification methylase domain-containing protein [Candidatus Hodarchaeales archaeon]|jgi:hypothetical protein
MLYKQTPLVEKKQKGQFFTEPHIAKKIVENICDRIVSESLWNPLKSVKSSSRYDLIEKSLDRLLNLRFLDPAMGEGVFLLEVMNYFEDFFLEINSRMKSLEDKDRISTFLRKKLSLDLNSLKNKDPLALDIWRLHILRSMLYGVDLDENILEEARKRILDRFQSQPIIEIAKIFSKINLRQGNSLISPISMHFQTEDNLLAELSKTTSKLISSRKKFNETPWNALELTILEDYLEEKEIIHAKFLSNMILKKNEDNTFSHPKFLRSAFIWEIEFPEVFYSHSRGFDVVLGNPPWDKWKMYNREWLGSTSLANSDHANQVKKIRRNDNQADSDYLTLKQYYKGTSQYFNDYYSWQPGEKNLYKLFLERFYYFCRNNGFLGIILPGGLLGEYYCQPLRFVLLSKMDLHSIREIISNKEMFSDAEPGLSILVLIGQKKKSKHDFLFIKGLTTLDEYISANWNSIKPNSAKGVYFRKKDILATSPRYIIPAVRNNVELQVMEKMIQYPSLSSDEWGCRTSRGLDMTNDRELLFKSKGPYPVVEGRHLVRLGYDNTNPRYFIHSIDKYQKIVPFWNQTIIAWKNFSGNHRRRRMRIAILPPMTPISNSVICLYQLPKIPNVEYYLAGIMCSIPFEFRIRQLCYGLNINQYVIDSITVPIFDHTLPCHQLMVELVKSFFPKGKEWARRKMVAKSSFSKSNLELDYMNEITKIDYVAAKIYELTRKEFHVTLKAHPLLEEKYKRMALSYYDAI